MAVKKRAHGDGYVKRLPNGTWSGQLMDGYKADGKKNIVNFSAPTKSEVQHKMRYYMEKRAEPAAQPEMPTFCGWADTWYKSYRTEVKPSTYSGYKHTLAHLKTYFGDTPIDMIHTMHINALLDQLHEQGASRSKIGKCRASRCASRSWQSTRRGCARRSGIFRSFSHSCSLRTR